jgi:hypothetical protein
MSLKKRDENLDCVRLNATLAPCPDDKSMGCGNMEIHSPLLRRTIAMGNVYIAAQKM